MQIVSSRLAYSNTRSFSPMVLDYVSGQKALAPFYEHAVSPDGIKAAVEKRRQLPTNRKLLTDVLKMQYKDIGLSPKQQLHLDKLSNDNTFTICTAHQPNIFTGHLYFVYKILHAIRLAESMSSQIEGADFVPVFYMGSEDADIEELGNISVGGITYEWKTKQTGAVGRMKVDKALVQLIDEFAGQLLVLQHGREIVDLMKACYMEGTTIEQATFALVNNLFAAHGLLVLLPDNELLKNAFAPIMQRELLQQFSHAAVTDTVSTFPGQYKVQAGGRELNLFYLTYDARNRIEMVNGEWSVVNTGITFTEEAILAELRDFPGRFSPNVILRPVFQEMILPNVAFIGGGGEIAYWLELKKVFEAAGVPFPVLVLRNSFLIVEQQHRQQMDKLGFTVPDLFKTEFELLNLLVRRDSTQQLDLAKEKQSLANLYHTMQSVAGNIDTSLKTHTEALCAKALQKIEALEKKMLRAERKKFEAQQRQVHKLKEQLFPNGSLQERLENILPYYARWGSSFIDALYQNSLSLEQEFTVITVSE